MPQRPLFFSILSRATAAFTWLMSGLVLLAVVIFGSEGASYALIPGVRGPALTIPLQDPIPFESLRGGPASTFADEVDLPLPMPLPLSNPVSADPLEPSTPIPTVLSLSGRFDTGPAAAPYVFKGRSAEDVLRATLCLTSAIYYEAASESEDGQRAVAQVILNRVRHPSWPNTVCGVIYQGSDMPACQFSYACDGSMARLPSAAGWAKASRVARAALSGYVHAPVGLSTFYHTLAVSPVWNRSMTITNIIGNHIFFRLPGAKSMPSAFYEQYAGGEPYPGPLPRRTPWPARAASVTPQTALAFAVAPNGQTPSTRQSSVRDDKRYVTGALPESDALPQYRESGRWIGN